MTIGISSIRPQLQSLLLKYLRETKIGELLLQGLDHVPPNVVHLVIPNVIRQSDFIALRNWVTRQNVRLKLVTLIHAGITTNGANIDHAIAELNKGTALLWQLDLGNVSKAEVCQLLVLLLAEPLDEAIAGKRLAEAVGHQTIFGEAKVKQGGDISCR